MRFLGRLLRRQTPPFGPQLDGPAEPDDELPWKVVAAWRKEYRYRREGPWSIEWEVAHATRVLEVMARQTSIPLRGGGVRELKLSPCPPPEPPAYGTREGTWADAEVFMREWREQGKHWVDISLVANPGEDPRLCYVVPFPGENAPPLDHPGPAIGLDGPAFRKITEMAVARATRVLQEMARDYSLTLPAGGLRELKLVPCPDVPPPPYGTREGTWAQAEDFVREWREQGKDWVNIGLRADPDGTPFLCYEVPDRGESGPPLDFPPSINLNGPTFGPPHYDRPTR